MKLKPFEDFKESQYYCVGSAGIINTSPLMLTPNNYFCNFNTLRSYDIYSADIILSTKQLLDMFEPVEYFNYIDYNVAKNNAVLYHQVYKRKGNEYYILVDVERYDDDSPDFLQDEFIVSAVYYDNTDRESCVGLTEDLNNFSALKKNDKGKMMIVLKTMSGFVFKRRKIKPYSTNIASNYNDDFLPIYEAVVDSLKTKEKGIILFHGLAGTGKTNLIRHLTTVIPDKNFVFIPTSMIPHLTDPTFLSSLMDNKRCVLVLEDSEAFLKDRDTSGENSVVSAILNLSDGLLSDVLGIQIICTFNADLGKVDEALLREGRLVAEYEFGKLSLEKTQEKAKELGFDVDEPMTLAAIYNLNNVSHRSQSKKKKIGFGT